MAQYLHRTNVVIPCHSHMTYSAQSDLNAMQLFCAQIQFANGNIWQNFESACELCTG